MMLRRLALGAVGAWAAYAWGAHLIALTCIRRGPRGSRHMALTFDDGPDAIWTPRVLDLLAKRDVRASFFLVGARAARCPDIVRAMSGAGHEVANHGWSHRSLWFCGPRRTASEIGRAHELLTALSGRAPRYFRPPWGMVNAAMFSVLHGYRLRCVLWSIQPEGLRGVEAPAQIQYVARHAHPGGIVDLHDAEGTPEAPRRLCEALPAMIDALRDADYTLTTVSELLDGRSRPPR